VVVEREITPPAVDVSELIERGKRN
jgi:hypothetical protein